MSDIPTTQILVSPNPAKDFIYIKNIDDKNLTVEFLDMVGRSILTTEVSEQDKSIDVTTLKPGNYILVLKKDDLKIMSQKIIKEY